MTDMLQYRIMSTLNIYVYSYSFEHNIIMSIHHHSFVVFVVFVVRLLCSKLQASRQKSKFMLNLDMLDII